jgi:hypothetical protein
MKKKTLFLGIAMLLSVANIFAQGGTTGLLTWKIENNTLTISGIGEMPDYISTGPPPTTNAPWFNYSFNIVIIENGVTTIGNYAFEACGVTSVSIPNSVTRIGGLSFGYCGLSSIILPNSVITIENGAFAVNEHLTSVTLPKNVTTIGHAAFGSCYRLASITNLNPVPIDIVSSVFQYLDVSEITLSVPKSSVEAYQNALVWQEFNIVGINVDIEEYDPKSGGGEQLMIYPNPTTGTCSITIPEEFLHEVNLTLSIYDNSGRLIQQIPVENAGETFKMNLELKAQGVYSVVLSNGKKGHRGRIVFN